MKKEQYLKVVWAIVVVTSVAEAVCGKKFMKRIGKRLKALDKEVVVAVWVGVYNQIRPYKSVKIDNSVFAHSPIARKECHLIVEKITSRFNPNSSNLDERLKRIVSRKSERIYNDLKKRLCHGSDK